MRVCSGFISHTGVLDRCADLGWGACRENVAWNLFPGETIEDAAVRVMEQWRTSPEHFVNINTESLPIGAVGYHICEDGRYYFTAMFGEER